MLSDADADWVAIALTPCLKKERESLLHHRVLQKMNTIYTRKSQGRLKGCEAKRLVFVRLGVPSFDGLIKTVRPTNSKRNTKMRGAVTGC
jgi:hypothetical protein